MSLTPSLGQLLSDLEAAIKGSMSTALPATVVTYDPLTQTITAKPSISARFSEPTSGALIPVPLPAIANIPVAFPKGLAGTIAVSWPLAPGDEVVLVMADRSLDEWKSTGLPENIPVDTRRFDLTDAIAYPAGTSTARPIPPTGIGVGLVLSAPLIQIGSSVAVSGVVLDTLLSAFLDLLRTWLDTHTHPIPGVGTSGVPTTPSPEATGLGSLKVKAE